MRHTAPKPQKDGKRPKPALVPASAELKQLLAAVEHEVASWPRVRLNPMFGMTAIYRGKTIFGLLPKTRSLQSGDSVCLKFAKLTPEIQKKIASQSRVLPPSKPGGAQWHTLSEITPGDYSCVIDWLVVAYEAAK